MKSGLILIALVEVLDGALVVADVAIGQAAAVIGDGVVAVELDGAVVIRNGAVGLALGAIGHAAIEVGEAVIGVEFDRLAQDIDGALVVALVVIDVAERIEARPHSSDCI